MVKQTSQYFSFQELCYATQLPSETIIEMIEQGIIDPTGDTPDNWNFSIQMITVTKKAKRLHRDLDIEWSAIALIISLIDELDSSKKENKLLRSQLSRFMLD